MFTKSVLDAWLIKENKLQRLKRKGNTNFSYLEHSQENQGKIKTKEEKYLAAIPGRVGAMSRGGWDSSLEEAYQLFRQT